MSSTEMVEKRYNVSSSVSAPRRSTRRDIFRMVPGLLTRLNSFWLRLTYPFAFVGKNAKIHYTCHIARETAHRIKLGEGAVCGKDVWLSIFAPPEESGAPLIVLEEGCQIGFRTTISAKKLIHIEKNVITAQSVLIMDHSHAYEDVTKPIRYQGVTEGGEIRIGEGCWIGHGAVIACSKGDIRLGRNCVVAANSVVMRSFPANSVISGNPARVVKQFDADKNAWVLGASRQADI